MNSLNPLITRTPSCEGARLRATYPAAFEGDAAEVDGADDAGFESLDFVSDDFDSEGFESDDFDSDDDELVDFEPLPEDFSLARESLR
jgi:hypothetical protein